MKNIMSAGALGLLALLIGPAAQAATWEPVPMIEGPQVKADPLNVWTQAEVAESLQGDPNFLRFWVGKHFAGDKTVIISMMNSTECGMQVCPVKIVLQTKGGKARVMMDGEMVCNSPALYAIESDLSAFKACGKTYPLK